MATHTTLNSLFTAIANTGGTFAGTPSINTVYYVNWQQIVTKTCSVSYNGSTISSEIEEMPVSISYNGSQLVSFDDGTKTLKCNGKQMASDVTIGTKTLKCNGDVMSSNVTITVS